ncbi:DsbA family protein [Pacificibacter marinus]|uniref:Disulfide bond formation protein D n=1 Tax=Pacificibacter marinus TaxID=658057 RepID=A0A1Y5TCY9_9RHOB|nr:DsbA family protein [Pacificibacter marinus]SEL13097.1 Protein-disulfide isomerase [Pacificibacter marinus]SLN61193.1 Disulfide bond formation protein D precursor [Pacificibacter marinus]
MNRRNFMMTTALAALGVGGAYIYTSKPQVTDFLVEPASAQDAADVDTSMVKDLVMGEADAPIELIEYASYTCPHCANFHATVFEQLKENYIDTGKVRFVYREVYFDKYGLWAAMVARCGGDLRYFGIQGMLYEQQQDWIAGGKDAMEIVENLRTIGKKAGLSDADLDACMNDGAMAQAMVAKFEREVAEYDVSGTPTLIINGEKNSNMSYDDLAQKLDALLEA